MQNSGNKVKLVIMKKGGCLIIETSLWPGPLCRVFLHVYTPAYLRSVGVLQVVNSMNHPWGESLCPLAHCIHITWPVLWTSCVRGVITPVLPVTHGKKYGGYGTCTGWLIHSSPIPCTGKPTNPCCSNFPICRYGHALSHFTGTNPWGKYSVPNQYMLYSGWHK